MRSFTRSWRTQRRPGADRRGSAGGRLAAPSAFRQGGTVRPAAALAPWRAIAGRGERRHGGYALDGRLEAEIPGCSPSTKIVEALGRLVEAANAEHKLDYVRLAEKLMAHAPIEGEVSYPRGAAGGPLREGMPAR